MLVLEGGLSADARASFERAWAIARTHAESPDSFNTLWGLFFGDCIGGDTAGATHKAVDLVAMAERLERSDLMLEAHHATWSAAVLRGDLQHAIDHVERGLVLYDPLVHHSHVTKFGGGHDSGVCGYSQGAVALAISGRLTEARTYAERGLALIDRLSHPHTAALGSYLLASALEIIEEYAQAVRVNEASAAIARDKHFGLPLAAATLGAGSAWIGLGERERGIALIAGVLDTPGSSDPVRWRPYYLARMALAQIEEDQLEAAQRSIARAEEAARGPRGSVLEGEISRIAARLYRAQHQPVERVVERLLSARTWARDNGALLFELRATADLAALVDAGESAALARADLPVLLSRFRCSPDEPALRHAAAIAV
jgi:tetratricopeptide (TPR) repeat protein